MVSVFWWGGYGNRGETWRFVGMTLGFRLHPQHSGPVEEPVVFEKLQRGSRLHQTICFAGGAPLPRAPLYV